MPIILGFFDPEDDGNWVLRNVGSAHPMTRRHVPKDLSILISEDQ
jgi:hypothetical protein